MGAAAGDAAENAHLPSAKNRVRERRRLASDCKHLASAAPREPYGRGELGIGHLQGFSSTGPRAGGFLDLKENVALRRGRVVRRTLGLLHRTI